MYTITKSSSGITLIPMESSLLARRRVFLEGDITQETACMFIKTLMYLTEENADKPIHLFINTTGGDINAGLLIYDAIQSCNVPIRMYCAGRAYSMGAVLFCSGRHGRYMFPNSELMLHEPLLGNRVGGSSSSIKSISDSLLETKKKINRLLARHTGRTEEEIEAATGYDHYFSPEESIAFGLCDGTIGLNFVMED